MINSQGTPYHNLIVIGAASVGRQSVLRAIAQRIGVDHIDLDTEIQMREGMNPNEIRQIFGEARVRSLETTLCRELALKRGAVISVNGSTLTDELNRERLVASGPVIVLTCSLNEILRRLHVTQGSRFHDPKTRAAELNLIRRDQQTASLNRFPKIDTTYLSPEAVAEQAIAYWYEQETVAL